MVRLLSKDKQERDKISCIQCGNKKDKERWFYNTRNPLYKNMGKLPVCKDCIKSQINYNDMETVYAFLRQFDIKFDITYWNKAAESNYDTFGKYMTMANSLHQFEGTSWKDSVFKVEGGHQKTTKDSVSQFYDENEIEQDVIDKWGEGYTPEEYRAFERKYTMLKNNYQEKTAMHTEALLTYIRYRVKEEIATASNDMKSAKEWGQLAQKAAQDAKINPSQLSKSDLSDGLDTFGQLVRTVEQAVDIIPILPKFKEKPQDKPDFTLWCYINYIRDLKGLPLASYEEIYKFYEQRKMDYKSAEMADGDNFE